MVLGPQTQPTTDHVELQYLKKKNPCTSEPMKFKPVLLKCQVYTAI